MKKTLPTYNGYGSRFRGVAATGVMHLVVSLLVLATSACGRVEKADEITVEMLDSGVVRVTRHVLPERILRVDTLAVWDLWGEEAYNFNRISGAAGTEGGFYLMDTGNKEVVRVDMRGRPLQTFGRAGQGPGEFQFPFGLSCFREELWIPDMSNYRFSLYGLDGNYLKDIRWSGYRWFGDGFRLLPDGRVIYTVEGEVGFETAGKVLVVHSLLAFDPVSGGSDTLITMTGLPHETIEVTSSAGASFTFVAPPQFAPLLKWAYTGRNTILTVTDTEYRYEERGLDGRLLREFVVPTPDLRVKQRQKDWFWDEVGFRFSLPGGEVFNATRTSLQKYPFADRVQAIESITVDPLDRVWVQANTSDPRTTRMHIYERKGRFLGDLGDIPIPVAFTPGGQALLQIGVKGEPDRFLVISIRDHHND